MGWRREHCRGQPEAIGTVTFDTLVRTVYSLVGQNAHVIRHSSPPLSTFPHVSFGREIVGSSCSLQLYPNQSVESVRSRTVITHDQQQMRNECFLTKWMSPKPVRTKFFRSSHPIPPAPTTKTVQVCTRCPSSWLPSAHPSAIFSVDPANVTWHHVVKCITMLLITLLSLLLTSAPASLCSLL